MARKQERSDDAYAQPLTVGLEPAVWRTVKHCIAGASRDQSFADVISGATTKVGSVLAEWLRHTSQAKRLDYSKGEPNLDITSTVHGFDRLSKLLLKYWDKFPTGHAAAVMSAGVRNAVRLPAQEEAA